MTRWGFFRFALSIAAIIAGIWLGFYLGKTNENNQNRRAISKILKQNRAEDAKIRSNHYISKSNIIGRLQKHSRN